MNLTKSKIFLIFCLSFVLGAFLGRFSNNAIMVILAMIFVMIGSLGLKRRFSVVTGFAGIILVLGMFSWHHSTRVSGIPETVFGKKLEISGVIIEEPDERIDKTMLTLDNLSLDGLAAEGRILVTVSRFREYGYGDEIRFQAKITEPKDAEAAGEFSYKNYLSRHGIWGLVYYPESINLIESNQGSPIKQIVLDFKRKFIVGLSEVLPEPHNSFLAGVLVGARRGIPVDLQEKFNITGTTHIIAISGFNITIIAWVVDKLLQRFGRRISFVCSLLAIVLFVILTGASASVVRAGIMGALGLLAINIGRLYAINNALALTAALMVLINPKIIHFDVGFQLSFAALLGLIYLAEPIQSWFTRLPRIIAMPLSATLAAQIATLPLLLYNFDRLSLVAPLTNILILPIIPIIMGTGFVAGVLASVSSIISLPVVWVTWGLIEYVIKMIELTSLVPLSSLRFSIPGYLISLYYLFLMAVLKQSQVQASLKALMKKWKPVLETQSNG